MATKKKTVYVCTDCGYDTPKWQGKCPNCGAWNTMQEETITPIKSSDSRFLAANFGKPVRLSEITTASEERFDTGISELNRVLGGGMVKGSLILVSGEPGIGKSTLLLQTCANLCRTA